VTIETSPERFPRWIVRTCEACGGRRRRFTLDDEDPPGMTCSKGHFVAADFTDLVALNAALKRIVLPSLVKQWQTLLPRPEPPR
jgi:hypothetical protein